MEVSARTMMMLQSTGHEGSLNALMSMKINNCVLLEFTEHKVSSRGDGYGLEVTADGVGTFCFGRYVNSM